MRAPVTGSGGLIGSECERFLIAHGFDVVGIDNNMPRQSFGDAGSTMAVAGRYFSRSDYQRQSQAVTVATRWHMRKG
jgi:nucleoside-diphosphate-sugar epimerase